MNSIKTFATKNRTALNMVIIALTVAGLVAMDKVPSLNNNPLSIVLGIAFAVLMVTLFRVLDTLRIKAATK
jgi:hypothetical protein